MPEELAVTAPKTAGSKVPRLVSSEELAFGEAKRPLTLKVPRPPNAFIIYRSLVVLLGLE
jgi:hypothetical protein